MARGAAQARAGFDTPAVHTGGLMTSKHDKGHSSVRAALRFFTISNVADFLDVSHGFRPGRGAHGALDSLWKQLGIRVENGAAQFNDEAPLAAIRNAITAPRT